MICTHRRGTLCLVFHGLVAVVLILKDPESEESESGGQLLNIPHS